MTAEKTSRLRPALVAPTRHTVIFLAVAAALTVLGLWGQFAARGTGGGAAAPPAVNHLTLYLSVLAAEWGLFVYCRAGLRTGGSSVGEVVGRWRGGRSLVVDLGVAAALWLAWIATQRLWNAAVPQEHATSVQTLLSRTPLEAVVWVALSLSAAICEEFSFRGYLQRQFAAWMARPWAAVLGQAVVFGAVHAYQGWQAAAKAAIFGLMTGAVALWRGNLRAGIAAHAITDIVAGLL